MLDTLFKLISEQAVRAAKSEVRQLPGWAPHQAIQFNPDGTCVGVTAPPHPRHHTASSLDAVLQYVNAAETPSTIWFTRQSVVGVLDDGTRRDIVALPLVFTPQLLKLTKLDSRYDQKQLLRLLRIDLDGCVTDRRCIDAVRNVRWDANSVAEGVVTRGKESLGKAITQQVTKIDELPEETTLQVPVFANLQMPSESIRCAIEIDVGAMKFEFVPFPGEIEGAIQRAEERIGEMLVKGLNETETPDNIQRIKVCYGQP